jgi:hypothetical protein
VTKERRGAEVELRFRTAEQGGRSAPLLSEPLESVGHIVLEPLSPVLTASDFVQVAGRRGMATFERLGFLAGHIGCRGE